MQHAFGARNAEAAEEDRSVLRLDAPGAPGDGSRRVDDGQVDLGERGDTVEKRSAIRGGLREDGCDPDRRRIRRRGECAKQIRRVVVSSPRQDAPSHDACGCVRGEERIEARDLTQDPRSAVPCEPGERPSSRLSHSAELTLVRRLVGAKAALELDECRRRLRDILGLDVAAEPDRACERRLTLTEIGCKRSDLPHRDLRRERALKFTAPARRLLRMQAVQDERRFHRVAFDELENPRPEVVILGLTVGRVVAQVMRLQHVAGDDHRVVEGRRGKQRPPPKRNGSAVEQVNLARGAVVIDVEHARADEADIDFRAQEGQAALEPVRKRRVVGVHSRDVAPAGLVERTIERSREAELLVVAEDADAQIAERRQGLGSAVGGAVVDDDELEIGDRLA